MEILYQNKHFEWIDCVHPDQKTLAHLENQFKLDRLLLADTQEIGHLPKYENKDRNEFLILRFYVKEKAFYHNIVRQFSNKISIFRGKDFLITIHKHPIHFIQEIVDIIHQDKLTTNWTQDQLLYKIFKRVFETYQNPAHQMAELIDRFEEHIFISNRKKLDLKAMYQLKREASACKKVLTINLDALKEVQISSKDSAPFRDILELNQKMLHLHEQVLEDAQNLMTLSVGISDQKANEVMKVLTTFSAFFLPLSFIAGVYGMNFKAMPELDAPWGYPITLGAMILVVLLIYLWFRKKGIL